MRARAAQHCNVSREYAGRWLALREQSGRSATQSPVRPFLIHEMLIVCHMEVVTALPVLSSNGKDSMYNGRRPLILGVPKRTEKPMSYYRERDPFSYRFLNCEAIHPREHPTDADMSAWHAEHSSTRSEVLKA
ncbi:hypothetical protein BV20DRAFT_521593 [Pilatotrama ljubarskyi]|nr:hypothetical protein BV20DRAFT_521593 [Pilatotrama ljubarskyi]